ncbi:hypothetical protein L3X38_026375 [Prunus dulcis]|uniref:Uncharacterized protein n=1 Tax=Prunus dulcis TaxID=3755 RepID=A0AAD4YZE6_PRUDU|nr:hypothetical protein L3X38_026375 [Prunus dulcis]
MELPKLEQLLVKTVCEQADLAFRLQAAADMEMWLCMKRAVNAAHLYRERFEDNRAKNAEAGKVIRDVDQHAEEKTAKIAELSSRLAEAEKALVSAKEARAAARVRLGFSICRFECLPLAAAEVAKDAAILSRAVEVEEAKKEAVAEY